VKVSPLLSTSIAPIKSSLGWLVVAVVPDDGDVLLPVALAVLSRVPDVPRPENSSALIARAASEGCVTVMVFPLTRAAVIGAEKMTLRTPLVPDPCVTSTSFA